MVIIAQQPRFFTSHFGGIQTSCLISKEFLLEFGNGVIYNQPCNTRHGNITKGNFSTTAPIMGWYSNFWGDLIIFRMAWNYDCRKPQFVVKFPPPKKKSKVPKDSHPKKKTGSHGPNWPNVMKTNSDKRGWRRETRIWLDTSPKCLMLWPIYLHLGSFGGKWW